MGALFIVPCSLTKAEGGTPTYDESSTIAAVAAGHAERLAERREEVRALVKNGETVDWQSVPLKDLPHNAKLVKGREFGGRKGAAYMPAMDRYQGRFFHALRDDGKEAAVRRDRTLILSGLYGLLRAGEPTQLYSCPLSREVAGVWRRDQLLTDILLACIRHYDILRVFDLTAIGEYRQLIDWNRVADDGTEVLHCFDSMAAGESALTSFGTLFRHLVSLSDDELVSLDPEHPHPEFRTCLLQRSVDPPSKHPIEMRQPSQETDASADDNADAGLWQLTVSPHFPTKFARRDFEGVVRAILEICTAPTTPRDPTITRLKGNHAGKWRYSQDGWRLIYKPNSAQRVVQLLDFGRRDKNTYSDP